MVLLPGTRWLGVLAPEPGGHGTPHTPGLWWAARCPQAAGRSLGGFAAGLGAVWPAWVKAVLKWILILLHCITVVGYSKKPAARSLPLEDAVLTPRRCAAVDGRVPCQAGGQGADTCYGWPSPPPRSPAAASSKVTPPSA